MEYHKINAPFKRWMKTIHKEEDLPNGKKWGDFIDGEFSVPEFAYLFHNDWIWSEKLDGTNIRIYLWIESEDEEWYTIKGRTDKADIPSPLHDWIANYLISKRDILEEVFENKNVVLYGEGVGKKIQKGGVFGEQHFKMFDIKIGDFWLEKDAVKEIGEKVGIDTPPVWIGTIQEAIDRVKTKPKSHYGDFMIEGYVGQPIVRLSNAQGNRVVTKIKVKDFLG